MLRNASIVALFACLSLWSMACAPTNASQVRQDKDITVGLPGASYRPNGRVALGSTLGLANNTKSTVDTAKNGTSSLVLSSNSDAGKADQRQLTSSYMQVSPFLQYFAWDTSAFFVGFGVTYNKSSYRFDEQTSGSTALAPQATPVSYQTQSTYVSVPLGWAWIWGSGFSLTLDFGPKARVSRSISYATDGSGGSVDTAKRDRTVGTINSLEPQLALGGGSGIIGWSF